MNKWPCVDFVKLADELKNSRYGSKDLAIFGGKCAEKSMEDFFQQWILEEMPFRVWEYCSEIVFKKGEFPQNIALLERGRVFGEGGDLMLRRNGTDFEWRFIGPAGIQKPTEDYSTQDYWESNKGTAFNLEEKTALLWGELDGKQWVENRVGAAKLNYPAKGKRVQLNYKAFTHAGIVEFVWFTSLKEWVI